MASIRRSAQKLYPQEGPPIWNGRILWRGITKGDALPDRPHHDHGRPRDPEIRLLSDLAASRTPTANTTSTGSPSAMPPTYQWRREDCNRAGAARRVPALVRGLEIRLARRARPDPQLRRIAYEYPLVDRDPVDRWTFGRVTLMGDAAHPMYPIGSNGASQAILDARVLTREILRLARRAGRARRFEAERRPATTDLVMLNRRNGPEQVMQMVEERAPDGFDVVTDVLSQQELEDIAANLQARRRFSGRGGSTRSRRS